MEPWPADAASAAGGAPVCCAREGDVVPSRIRGAPCDTRIAVLLLLITACVPGSKGPVRRPPLAAAAVERSVLAAIDPAADPCADFYQYACGGWLAAVPPPEDRPQIMRSFTSMAARNRSLLVAVLEREGDEAWHRKASAFFDSCMDVARIATAGLDPLTPWRDEIDAAEDLSTAFTAAAALRRVPGASPFFALGLERDPADPGRSVLLLAPGGFVLPDARFYVDETHRGLVDEYRRHVARMLELTGVRTARARSQARAIVELERALARAALGIDPRGKESQPRAAIRGRSALQALDPRLPWDDYFAALGAPELEAVAVVSPAFVEGAGAALRGAKPETLRAYLRWHLLHAVAQRLGREFEEEDFAFESKLTGAIARPPRPERCADATLAALPDLVSRAYVEAAFSGDGRAVAAAMLDGIIETFRVSLPRVAWLSAASRAAAAEKAASVGRKVGHPESWPDDATPPVVRGRYLENALAAGAARLARELTAAGSPIDPEAWPLPANAMRGYYDPRANDIVLPAGLLQPPLFDVSLPAAMRWGAAGSMMAHEWTHAFDAGGQLFDASGHLAPWSSEATQRGFGDALACLVDRYDRIEAAPGLRVDGRLTATENAADVGGIALAHRAWQAEAGAAVDAPSPIPGLDNQQLFFVAYAQSWCASAQPGYDAAMVRSDPRARPRVRVNGPLAELPAFRESFSCPSRTPMAPEPVCQVW